MARSATAQYFQGVVALFFFTCVKDEIVSEIYEAVRENGN